MATVGLAWAGRGLGMLAVMAAEAAAAAGGPVPPNSEAGGLEPSALGEGAEAWSSASHGGWRSVPAFLHHASAFAIPMLDW